MNRTGTRLLAAALVALPLTASADALSGLDAVLDLAKISWGVEIVMLLLAIGLQQSHRPHRAGRVLCWLLWLGSLPGVFISMWLFANPIPPLLLVFPLPHLLTAVLLLRRSR